MAVCPTHNKLMEKIDLIVDSISDIKVQIAKLPEAVLEKADERYASKTVERAVYGIIGSLCLAVLLALYELVLKR